MRIATLATLGVLLAGSAACGPRDEAAREADGTRTTAEQPAATSEGQTGTATVYAGMFQGDETASGETFNHEELVAAHLTLETGTQARVTNLENNRSVTVRIIDRIPQRTAREGVVIDLSRRAARELGIDENGQAQVRIEPMR